LPDVINSCGEWDYYIAVLFRHMAGVELSMEDMHRSNPVAEIPRGHVFHENHEAIRKADRSKYRLIEDYSVGECRRLIKELGIKNMHLSE
jgi:hypothetical protein